MFFSPEALVWESMRKVWLLSWKSRLDAGLHRACGVFNVCLQRKGVFLLPHLHGGNACLHLRER